MKPRLYNRDFTERFQPEGLSFTVDSISFAARGGPKSAVISVLPRDINDLFSLLEYIGLPIVIIDDDSVKRWWGFVNNIKLRLPGVEVGISLDTMNNSIAVAYTKFDPGSTGVGERATTSWGQDAESIAIYGEKEYLETLADGSQSQAEGLRDALLERKKYPVALCQPAVLQEKIGGTIECSGWYNRIGWYYYENAIAANESYEDLGGAEVQNFGNDAVTEKVAQSFAFPVAQTWLLAQVDVHIKKIGAPVDNLTVLVCADAAGSPGATLATSVVVGGADVSDTLSWLTFTFSAPYISLSDSITYWIVIQRSGANDAVNYFSIDANEDLGYPRGEFKIYDSSGPSWGSRAPDCDTPFRVLGVVETSDQMDDLLADVSTGFISSYVIETASGIYSAPFRDGDTRANTILEDLMDSGESSSGRRYVCDVDDERKLTISVQPARDDDEPEVFMGIDGKIVDKFFMPIRDNPAGKWIFLRNILPNRLRLISDPGAAYVEYSEFNAKEGKWTVEYAQDESPLVML